MDKEVSLKDAAKATGIDRTTLFRWVTSEPPKLKGFQRNKGSRPTWYTYQSEVERLLMRNQEVIEKPEYEAVLSRWKEQLESGYHTGNKVAPDAVYSYTNGLANVWRSLEQKPDLSIVHPDLLRLALSKVPIDREKKNCHFSKREWMYKGFRSFYQLLVRENRRPYVDMDTITRLKPRRQFDSKVVIVREEGLNQMLAKNQCIGSGRKGDDNFDQALTEMILLTLAFTGLRRQELINLAASDIIFSGNFISLKYGKHGKHRDIGLMPELKEKMQDWIQNHRPKSLHENFLLQRNGNPITKNVIKGRIDRLLYRKNKDGTKTKVVEATPHALRRHFATLLSDEGLNLASLCESLGWSSLKVAKRYVRPESKKGIEFIRKLKLKKEEVKPQEGQPRKEADKALAIQGLQIPELSF